MTRSGIVRYDTPLGEAWIELDGGGEIVRCGLPGAATALPAVKPQQAVERLADCLSAYWRTGKGLPVGAAFVARAPTPLTAAIYRVVCAIAPGETRTYAEVAARAGAPSAARAVGAAMARNRFAPLIPCHRVVGSDGSLRGYAGGIEMKRYLLDLEQVHG